MPTERSDKFATFATNIDMPDSKPPSKPRVFSPAQAAKKDALYLKRLQRVDRLAQEVLGKLESGQLFSRPAKKVSRRPESRSRGVLRHVSNGVSVYGPEVKHEYADFKSKLRADGVPVTGSLSIKYENASGEASIRLISLVAIYPPLQPMHVLALCHLRNAERTFAVANVREAVDAQTGQRIDDLSLWLMGRIGA